MAFRLTQDERLDGHTDCTLWTPFAKMHVVGQLFISNNYICFSSKEEDLCQLIIPLREVRGQVGTPSIPWQFGARFLTHHALLGQVSVVEKADSSSVLPCPVSISTKNKMTFLFANLKDRDFLVQRISDFLQRTPDSAGPSVRPHGLGAPPPLPVGDAVLRPQVMFQSAAASESGEQRRHYHSELPTASQGLLQLYRSTAPEDLGPKAVSSRIERLK